MIDVLSVETLVGGAKDFDPGLRLAALREEYSGLENMLEAKRSDLVALSERLRSLHRERALAKREAHTLQNEIFQLKRRREELDSRLHQHAPNYWSLQEALTKLSARKKSLTDRLAELGKEIANLAEQLAALTQECNAGAARHAELEATKLGLVNEISDRLKNVSLDRDKVEEDLNRLAVEFRDTVNSRDELQAVYDVEKAAVDQALEAISSLEERIATAERIKALKAERIQAKEGLRTTQARLAEAVAELVAERARVEEARKKAEDASQALEQAKAAVAALELEVGEYSRARSCKRRRNTTSTNTTIP